MQKKDVRDLQNMIMLAHKVVIGLGAALVILLLGLLVPTLSVLSYTLVPSVVLGCLLCYVEFRLLSRHVVAQAKKSERWFTGFGDEPDDMKS